MHVMGRWNWWAPKPLAWLHDRFGISEGPKDEAAPVEPDDIPVQHNGYPVSESVTKIG
jgi:putative drug exporter of the RND superfamily